MITAILEKIIAGGNLSIEEMSGVMEEIMTGNLTSSQIGAFLVSLRMKGECSDEVTGGAMIMRRHAATIDAGTDKVIDTCGTGGDGSNTFNISTASSFVVAGAGITVAKHGNRSVSSQCGSADVLAALGFNLDVDPIIMEECIQNNGIGFLFAPKMHPAMKHVMPVRRELKLRTIFNMLGPLTNPAGATGQVIGVFDAKLTEMFAQALKNMGTRRAMIVHGHDGLDEITCTDETRVTELRDGVIKTYELYPEILLGASHYPEEIAGGDPETNAAIIKSILSGENQDGARAVVLLNAAAGIVVGEKADTLEDGLKLAAASIDSGAAAEKLRLMIEASNE
jgi:anthranilate phosphoribosyltransferase